MSGQQIDIVANLLMKVDGAEAGINKIKSSLSKLKLPEKLDSSFKKSFSNLDTIFTRYKNQMEKGFNTKADINAFSKTSRALDTELTRISKQFTELTGKEINFRVKSDEVKRVEKELQSLLDKRDQLSKQSLKFEIKGGKSGLKDIETLLQKIKEVSGGGKTGQHAESALNFLKTGDIQSAVAELNRAALGCKKFGEEKQKAFSNKTGFDITTVISKIITELTGAEGKFGSINTEIKKTGNELTSLNAGQLEKVGTYIEGLSDDFHKTEDAIRKTDVAAQNFAQSSYSMSQQLGDLKNSTQYFFSLRNMINLLKRGIDEAVQSVKDLDKAMTETAVVTDFKVSDMWGMLPEYTKVANELGATTQGAYETMTLYYQQGLNQQQAFELGAETMKMARIAGLDYAETTDMMTAALRGFNMELDEVSAKRVNDVYSKLAAITASDTEELGTAMQRTASIAHSAGMSFEGTTAFLAQAIETTREPAENLGTAMKTIVARFQEMKENPLEITEVEGEEVSYNKVDKALQSIGVSLKDTNGQFRELDQVFLDISQRWDSLSQTQQRYIATTAAGSRQQSRFIAMMSNYDRTIQLVEAANNSAGASDEQFGKTMDSLESKLNKLHNAWQAFTMGIADNGMIKFAVDGLTTLLTTTNKIIDTLSGGNGAIKSFLSVFAAFTGLKAGGRIINSLIGGLGGLIDPTSGFGKGLLHGATGQKQNANMIQAKAISEPIVNKLNAILTAVNKVANIETSEKSQNINKLLTTRDQYKDAKAQFRGLDLKSSFKFGEASSILDGLDEKHQLSLLNNSPGTKTAMRKAGMDWLNNIFDDKAVRQQAQDIHRQIWKGMTENKIPVSEGKKLLGRPDLWGDHFGTDAAKAVSKSFTQGITKEIHNSAEKGAWRQLGMKGASTEAKQAFLQEEKNLEKFKSLTRENEIKGILGKRGQGGLEDAKGRVSSFGMISNLVGSLGDGFTQAGFAVSSFGAALSQLGGPIGAVGGALQSLGGVIANVGMTISGITNAAPLLAEGFTSLAGTLGVSTVALGAFAGLAAAAGIALYADYKHMKNIQDAAKEVSDNFEETNKRTQDNISQLKSYKDELATLSQGVDSNGNNINLSDADYARYLEIVDDIANMNPEIIQGYNAQGHAIINNNTALQKTLELQEKIKQEAINTYTEEEALEKLLKARNEASADYAKGVAKLSDAQYQKMYGTSQENAKQVERAPLTGQAVGVAGQIKQSELYKQNKAQVDAILNSYNISLKDLIAGEKNAVDTFVKNQSNINSQLGTAALSAGVELEDSFTKAFDKLGTDTEAFNASIEPIYKNLATRVSNSLRFQDIAPEMQSFLMTGLQDLAKQDLSAGDMINEANQLTTMFANLSEEGSAYSKAIQNVSKYQEEFADTLDKSEYKTKVQPAIDELYRLRDEADKIKSSYGKSLTEFYDNQIAQIENFTQDGSQNITDALNTMSQQFASARGAYDAFSEAVKDNEFDTAAKGMKKIFEEINTDEAKAGLGSKSFWTGAESLLGAENIEGKGKEAVAKMLDGIEPMLQEGEDGFQAFWQRVSDHADELNKLDGVKVGTDGWFEKWPDDLSEVAKELGISENLLSSMLDKARQFTYSDFSDPSKVREALAASSTTLSGLSGDKKNLYVKESSMRASLREADYTTRTEQNTELERLKKEEQVFTIGNPEDLSNAQVQAMKSDLRLGSLPELIETFGQTGEYTRDEIKGLAERFGYDDEKQFEQDYSDWVEKTTDPTQYKQTDLLSSLDSNVANIAGSIVNKRIEEGHLDNPTATDTNYAIFGEKGKRDTLAQLFSVGKNGNGEAFRSESEYTRNRDQLQNALNKYNSYLETLKTGKENASNDTERKKFDAEIKAYENITDKLDEYLKSGEEAWQEIQKEQSKTEEAKRKAEEENKKYQERQGPENKKDATSKTEEASRVNKANAEAENQKYRQRAMQAAAEAENEKYKQRAENGTLPSFQVSQEEINQRVAQLVKLGFKDSLNSIDPTTLATPEAQSAINELVKTSLNPTDTITPEIENALSTLGLTIQDAINAGLILDTTGIYTNAEKTGKDASKAANDGVSKGLAQSNAQIENQKYKNRTQTKQPPTQSESTPETKPGTSQLEQAALSLQTGAIQINTGATTLNTAGTGLGQSAASLSNAATNLTSAASTLKTSSISAPKSVPSSSNAPKGSGTTVQKVSVQPQAQNIKVPPQTMRVTADTSSALSKIRQLTNLFNKTYTLKYKASGPTSIKVPISANFTGSWEKTVKINKSGAKGINNHIPFRAPVNLGSLAKGSRYGTVGPKGRGGLTLTGEEGFEIAWLPSENRSMILGLQGPQMINLPSDAVVYTHEQSEDILKREAIDAGSHRAKSKVAVSKKFSGGSKSKKSKKSKKKSKKKNKNKNKNKNKETINNFSMEEVVRFNIDQSLTRLTDQIADRTKEIENVLTKIGSTYNDIVDSTQAQVGALQQVKTKNQELLASYQRQLAEYRSRQAIVSYTDSKGNSKDKKISIETYLNPDGSANEDAIRAAGGREVQEAIYKEISSAKSIVDGINNANKAIKDADQQIADLGKKISEAFYQWENELTEVYDLTQRINNEVSFTDRFTSQIELELSKLKAGFGDTAESIENVRDVLNRNNKTIREQIANQQQMIAARQRELEAALSYQDEIDKREKFEDKTDWDSTAEKDATIAWAREQETGAMLGNKYVKNLFKDIDGSIQYEIDWEGFNADNEINPYSKTTYEAIKKYLDELNDTATEFNNAIKDQTDFIKDLYDKFSEYQDFIADMEDTLIKGVEELIEETKDNAKDLSDAITDALEDLLDEVKRKLDERRRQEDNAKTERDISQKQQRLAMLRADTSGGNQVEIAQLEKEIAEAQQDYQRTLEDQLLDKLQEQADEAAKQRERQIELLETIAGTSGTDNRVEVETWLKNPAAYKKQIRDAWLEAQGYDEKGWVGKYVLEQQFESEFTELVTAVEETNLKNNFEALDSDANTIIGVLEDLTNGNLGREDKLAHGVNSLLDVTDRNTTSILTEIQKGNLADLRKQGVDAATLKSMKYDASTLMDIGGYTPEELQKAGFTAKEVFDAGITDIKSLKDAGYKASDIKKATNGSVSDFKEAEFTLEDLKDIFDIKELLDANFSLKDFHDVGISASALKENGLDIQQLKNAGYSLPELKGAFSAEEFKAGNISYADAKAAEYTMWDLNGIYDEAATEIANYNAAVVKQQKIDAYKNKVARAASNKKMGADEFKSVIAYANAAGISMSQMGKDLADTKGLTWEQVVKAAKKAGYGKSTVKSWWYGYGGYAKKAIDKWSKFKTGGLANYTGPAWLDGTPSKPELVLNATDTKNFIALKDVLSRAMSSTSDLNSGYGDVNYEININVEKLTSDYDVDKVADRVKKIIVKDSSYRNVTQVRKFR